MNFTHVQRRGRSRTCHFITRLGWEKMKCCDLHSVSGEELDNKAQHVCVDCLWSSCTKTDASSRFMVKLPLTHKQKMEETHLTDTRWVTGGINALLNNKQMCLMKRLNVFALKPSWRRIWTANRRMIFYLCLELRGWGHSSVKWHRLSDEEELSAHRKKSPQLLSMYLDGNRVRLTQTEEGEAWMCSELYVQCVFEEMNERCCFSTFQNKSTNNTSD